MANKLSLKKYQQMYAMIKAGMSKTQIAEIIGCAGGTARNFSSIVRRAEKGDYEPLRKWPLDPKTREWLCELFDVPKEEPEDEPAAEPKPTPEPDVSNAMLEKLHMDLMELTKALNRFASSYQNESVRAAERHNHLVALIGNTTDLILRELEKRP